MRYIGFRLLDETICEVLTARKWIGEDSCRCDRLFAPSEAIV